MSPQPPWEVLTRQIRECQLCPLHQHRTHAAPGEGPVPTQVMLIGEAPGFHEDRSGRPFVGAAGRLLTHLPVLASLRREEVFITNLVKCRPPRNRDPLPTEVEACKPYLEAQLAMLQPRVIVTLGRFAMAHFLPQARIRQVHGRVFRMDPYWLVPMYHPAAALYREPLRPMLEQDFRQLGQVLERLEQGTAEEPSLAP